MIGSAPRDHAGGTTGKLDHAGDQEENLEGFITTNENDSGGTVGGSLVGFPQERRMRKIPSATHEDLNSSNQLMEVNRQKSPRFVRTPEGIPDWQGLDASPRRLPHQPRSGMTK